MKIVKKKRVKRLYSSYSGRFKSKSYTEDKQVLFLACLQFKEKVIFCCEMFFPLLNIVSKVFDFI